MKTLWSQSTAPSRTMLTFTVGDDRVWDSHLLSWDVLGSLGHVEGLVASRLLSGRDRARLRSALRRALAAVDRGRLRIGPEHEDAHSAIEAWLVRQIGSAGERVHTGRSRNDQVATDLRLFLKDRLLGLHHQAAELVERLFEFAAEHRTALWPGYTHFRRAMPSSAGLWAAGLGEGLLDTVESLEPIWRQVDRSPLGSAAGYGVPLPLVREAAAKALGFGGVEHSVTQVQNGRGKLEASVLFWCVQLGHDLSRLATDVIVFSAEEYGYLELPARFATGSSIMPHKRNPDVFELCRARIAALEGDLAAVLQLRAKLTSGYHRDFQLLKEPLIRGLGRIHDVLEILNEVVPELGVRRDRGAVALVGGALATDEVMRRVEEGTPFRRAYAEVSALVARGESVPRPATRDLIARRSSTGGMGNLDLAAPRTRLRVVARWQTRERKRFDRAMARLAGRKGGR